MQALAEAEYDAQVAERLWQHQHLLPPRQLRLGLHSQGDPARMRRFVHKLLSGQPVSVSTVGGSITEGVGAATKESFVDRLFEFISNTSTAANHTLRNPAFGGSTSGIFTVCVRDMVQADVDLVVVEFATNDQTSTGAFRTPNRLGFERLLRKLLEFDNRPAVLVLSSYAWNVAGGNLTEPADYVVSGENDMNVLGQYYQLPLLSLRAAAYHLMRQTVPGFIPWPVYWGHESVSNRQHQFYADEAHPLGSTGHRALADLVVGLVQAAAADLAVRPLDGEDEAAAQEPLPPPMAPGNYQRKSPTCLLSLDFQPVVKEQQGWEWRNERNASDPGIHAGAKWGWIANTTGAWAELEIDTTTELKGELTTPTNEVVLSFLKSYEHMGQASVECRSGCQCNATQLDGYWHDKVSLSELHRFQATPHAACRIRVTVLPNSTSPDGGRKVKLVGVMVVEGFAQVEAAGLQLDLFANRHREAAVTPP